MRKPSDAQLAAITHINGPAIIVAGPGSGKTFTLVERISYLINQGNISPDHILVITFSKEASKEMKKRYKEKCSDDGVTFCTFHSLAYSILRYSFNLKNDCVISSENKRRYLAVVLKNHGFYSLCDNENLNSILDLLSFSKNTNYYNNISIDSYFDEIDKDTLNRLVSEYCEILCQNHLFDFDDLIIKCIKELKKHPDILQKYRNKYHYIMIDEFQDINSPQYDLIMLLANPTNNIMVVGDDDQAIYAFRGSSYELMNRFETDFPNAQRIMLTLNFRSQSLIVELSDRIISENKGRYNKDLKTINKGGEIRHLVVDSRADEEKTICNYLNKMSEKEKNYTAIILRTNRECKLYEEVMLKNRIKIRQVVSSTQSLFDSETFLDIFAFYKFIYEGNKRVDFLRFMNKPNRFIQRSSLNFDVVEKQSLLHYYSLNHEMKRTLNELFQKIDLASKMNPQLAGTIFKKTLGYEEYIYNMSVTENQRKILLQNMDKSLDIMGKYDFKSNLDEFINHIKNNDAVKNELLEKEGISIITMHASKGLEFENVIIPDVNEGVIPDKKSQVSGVEEERRLFYVAVTRAKSNLLLLSTKERNRDISRFLKGKINHQ